MAVTFLLRVRSGEVVRMLLLLLLLLREHPGSTRAPGLGHSRKRVALPMLLHMRSHELRALGSIHGHAGGHI